MRALAVAAAAAAVLLPAPAAVADPPVVTGILCLYAAATDPTVEGGTYTGAMSLGPAMLVEQDGVTPETGTLTCRLQPNRRDHRGFGPSVSSSSTLWFGAPGTLSYTEGDAGTAPYLCAEFTDSDNGVTYYWDADANHWSTDPGVPCDGPGTDGPVGAGATAVVCPSGGVASCRLLPGQD